MLRLSLLRPNARKPGPLGAEGGLRDGVAWLYDVWTDACIHASHNKTHITLAGIALSSPCRAIKYDENTRVPLEITDSEKHLWSYGAFARWQ